MYYVAMWYVVIILTILNNPTKASYTFVDLRQISQDVYLNFRKLSVLFLRIVILKFCISSFKKTNKTLLLVSYYLVTLVMHFLEFSFF